MSSNFIQSFLSIISQMMENFFIPNLYFWHFFAFLATLPLLISSCFSQQKKSLSLFFFFNFQVECYRLHRMFCKESFCKQAPQIQVATFKDLHLGRIFCSLKTFSCFFAVFFMLVRGTLIRLNPTDALRSERNLASDYTFTKK
jgi:hypothetical protein